MNFRQYTNFNQLTNGSYQTCSSIQGTQITVESVFISRFTMNNIAPKLQKRWTHKIAFKIISKMLKQPNFFQSWPSTLPKDAPAKFYLSTTFGLRLMISSVAPTRQSTFYAYLITKIGNRNLKGLHFLGLRFLGLCFWVFVFWVFVFWVLGLRSSFSKQPILTPYF